MRLKHTAAKVWGHSLTSFVPCSLWSQLHNTDRNFSSVLQSEFKTKYVHTLTIWNKNLQKSASWHFHQPVSSWKGKSQEYWSSAGTLSAKSTGVGGRDAIGGANESWRIQSWLWRQGATPPWLRACWLSEPSGRQRRQPQALCHPGGPALWERRQRGSLAELAGAGAHHSLRQAGACIHHAMIQARLAESRKKTTERPHSAYLTGQLVLDSCLWWLVSASQSESVAVGSPVDLHTWCHIYKKKLSFLYNIKSLSLCHFYSPLFTLAGKYL